MAKKKMNKIEEATIKKMAISLIIVSVLFISILLIFVIYLITLSKSNRYNDRTHTSVDVDKVLLNEFYDVTITDSPFYIKDICSDECFFQVRLDNKVYKFYIENLDDDYMLHAYNNIYEITSTYLGEELTSFNINYYKDNIIFSFEYDDYIDKYDEVIVFDGDNFDVIKSLGTNEIELTNDGVIYYTYACVLNGETNAIKHKNIRVPFESIPTVIDQENINSDVC